jgi:hypothetical protein
MSSNQRDQTFAIPYRITEEGRVALTRGTRLPRFPELRTPYALTDTAMQELTGRPSDQVERPDSGCV